MTALAACAASGESSIGSAHSQFFTSQLELYSRDNLKGEKTYEGDTDLTFLLWLIFTSVQIDRPSM